MSLIDYHRNTTRELLALKDNVRNLIHHWGEDGRYKEAVLKNMIQRFLPERYRIATGFVIRQTNNRGEHQSSRQIDLLIYDDASPVIFKEGDFVILAPDGVRAIIEVKANLQNQDVTGVIRQANENGRFIFEGANRPMPFFNGIFSFESNGFNEAQFRQQVNGANAPFVNERFYRHFKVNHISLDQHYFMKYWPQEEQPHSVYDIRELSFAFFLANLMHSLAHHTVGRNNHLWFADDKELHRIDRF